MLVAPAAAQVGRGTIQGVVTDSSGAALVGAKIAITNIETNTTTNTQTNGAGFYTTPPINVGHYQVTADMQGFKKEVRSGMTLEVDQKAEINLQLQVGAASESVQVTAEAPLVNTENPSIGQVIENEFVADLPLDGGNALALVLLAADVHSNAGTNNQSGFGDRGTSLSDLSINGGPNAANNLLVDGMVAQNSYYPDLNANLGVDAVQEFKVQSGSMSAEYGFTLGGVINMATKGGGNLFHGSLSEFFRNDKLDARNAFSPLRAPYRYNQWGAAIGGPVILPGLYHGKNKTFWFFNYGGYDYITYYDGITSTPPLAQRTGDFSGLYGSTGVLIPIYDPHSTATNNARTPFPGNIIPKSELDPVAQAINQFYPAPNYTPTNAFTQVNNYYSSLNKGNQTMSQYTGRVDEHLSDRDSFFARFTWYVAYTNNCPCVWPSYAVNGRYDHFGTRNAAFEETHTFSPRVINEFRVGMARQSFPFQQASYGQDWPQKLGLPSNVPNTTFPIISGDGYTTFGGGTVGYRGALTWDASNTMTIVLGKQNIKIGAEYRLLFGNNLQNNNPSGTFNFSSGLTDNPLSTAGTGSAYASFLLGAVSSASVVTNVGESEKGYTLSGFVQDDWRVSRNLNLSLGLRYDYQQPPYERNCGTSNFLPNVTDPVNGLLGSTLYACKGYGPTYWQPNYNNFAPRFGFAWDPIGNGKMAIRGGYAIFYPGTFNILYFGNTSGFASTTTSYSAPGGNGNLPAFYLSNGFPSAVTQPLGASLGPAYLLGSSVTYDQTNQATPMSQQFSLSLQKQLMGGFVVEIDYSGNRGTHLVAGSYNLNQLNPIYDTTLKTALQSSVPNPYYGIVPSSTSLGGATITRQQSLLPYPYYTSILVRNPHLGNSMYNGGILRVQKRLSKGFTFLASYTKSKLIDDSVATPIGFGSASTEQVNSNSYQDGLYNRSMERSIDPTDFPQRLSISAVYKLPIGPGQTVDVQNRIANAIVGGWQAQTVVTLQKGNPVLITGASNDLATRPNSTGISAQLSNPNQYEWFNTQAFVNPPLYTYGNVARSLPDVRNPGWVNCDFSMSKSTLIKERFKLQLRVEAFNLDNHVNLGYPSTGFSAGANGYNNSSTFGVIVSARNPRLGQLGLKLNF
jgi:hypothetical protein